MFVKENETVLFQGDSLTDMGRNEDPNGLTDSLGFGYVYSVVSTFNAMYPNMNVKFINRGISGNRVKDLQARWQEDALDLNPDVLSVLIGVNDTWRRFDETKEITSAQAYEDSYRDILTRSRAKNPNLKIILMDPFFLFAPDGDPTKWREDLNPRIEIVQKLAKEFGALHIKLDEIFADACKTADAKFWAPDGVHPGPNGRALLALAWLKAVGAM